MLIIQILNIQCGTIQVSTPTNYGPLQNSTMRYPTQVCLRIIYSELYRVVNLRPTIRLLINQTVIYSVKRVLDCHVMYGCVLVH